MTKTWRLCVFWLVSASFIPAQEPSIRAYVWEFSDSHSQATGATQLLQRARVGVEPLPLDRSPAVLRADLILLGSFCSEHPRYAAYMEEYADDLQRFVSRGGLLVQLSQNWEAENSPRFLPKSHSCSRGEGDLDGIRIIQKRHPLFRSFLWAGENPPQMHIPRHLNRGPNWNYLEKVDGFEVLAASRQSGQTLAALLEMEHGQGRILLSSLFLDKILDAKGDPIGDENLQDAAQRFFFNLVDYTWLVKSKEDLRIEPVYMEAEEPLENAPGQHISLELSLYWDQNRNGQRDANERPASGILVTNQSDVAKSDPHGRVELKCQEDLHPLFSLTLPEEATLKNSYWSKLEFTSGDQAMETEVGLAPLSAAESEQYEKLQWDFLHLNQLHLRVHSNADKYWKDLDRILKETQPLFVVAGGNLCTAQNQLQELKHLQSWFAERETTVRWVPGPKDIGFEKQFGPRYYSWELPGYRCIVLDSSHWNNRQKLWLELQLQNLENRRQALIFQHHPASAEQQDIFSQYPVAAFFYGAGHTQGLHKRGNTLYASGPAFRHAGADSHPRGYQIVRAAWGGKIELQRKVLQPNLDFHWLSPAPQERWRRDSVPLLVRLPQAFDSRNLPTYKVLDPRKKTVLSQGRLGQRQGWLWEASFRSPRDPGKYEVRVEFPGSLNRLRTETRLVEFLAAPELRWEGEFLQHRGGSRKAGSVVLAGDFRKGVSPLWATYVGSTGVSSPIATKDRVYIAQQARNKPEDGTILCLDSHTGRQRWFVETEGAVIHTPAIFEQTLLALTSTGTVHAFHSEFGSPKYSTKLPIPSNGFECSAPTIHNDRAFFNLENGAAAIRVRDGQLLWHRIWPGTKLKAGGVPALGASEFPSLYASPSCSKKFVALGGPSGLFLLHIDSGEILWHYPGYAGAPILDRNGKQLWAILNGRLVGFKTEDRDRRVWSSMFESDELLGWCPATPALAGKRILIPDTRGGIHAFQRDTGKPIWSASTETGLLEFAPGGGSHAHWLSSPVVVSTEVITASTDGNLRILDSESGELISGRNFGVPLSSSPAVTGDILYLSTWDGWLLCLAPTRTR